MPRTASPIVFPAPRRGSYTDFEKTFFGDPRFICRYDQRVEHRYNSHLDRLYDEQLIVQERETGKFFWPHRGSLVPVKPLTSYQGAFKVADDYQD